MAKLWFRYGAMGSSKTANAIMVAFNYEEKGLKPLVLKPKIDDRDGADIIKSRMGLTRKCGFVEDFFYGTVDEICERLKAYDCVIIDEVQFCEVKTIELLPRIVVKTGIPIICYGLRTDFLLNPFPASEKLCGIADRIEELKTVCWCGQGANCNARLDAEGNVVRSGAQVMIGGSESYTSLCMKHYMAGDIGEKMREAIRASHSASSL
ncbi:MAG: thymidine kinase [Lachnospiraceae bacterium]|nr:thymidine kinase [Lachnospiraceae bacterium]